VIGRNKFYEINANKVTNAAIESFHFKCKLIKSTYTNIYVYNYIKSYYFVKDINYNYKYKNRKGYLNILVTTLGQD